MTPDELVAALRTIDPDTHVKHGVIITRAQFPVGPVAIVTTDRLATMINEAKTA